MPHYVRTLLVTGPAAEVEAARDGHRAQLRQLREEGRLVAAGAFRHGEGFLEIFTAKDLYEAEAIARGSPLVEEGLVSWILREWEPIEP